MKGTSHILKIGVLSATLFASIIFCSQASDKHTGPGPTETESKLWLVGDSSLHVYSSTAHHLKAEFSFSPNKPVYDQLKTGDLKALEVTVPVKEMRSGKDGLDKNMQKALKADEYPNIVFHLEKYEIVASTISKGTAINALGTLEIAGVKKPTTLTGTLTQENNESRIEGSKELLMTDFGIKPPKILVIKAANEVTVHYDLRLDEKGLLK